MGGSLRHRRWAALPRHHRPGVLLHARPQSVGRALHLGWRARDLGCRGAGRGGRLDRLPPPRRLAARLRRRPRTRSCAGPGGRPLGQLVQPGALRSAQHATVGAGDRPRAPSTRHAPAGDLPAHVPLRVALGPRRRRAAALGGAALDVGQRAAVRPLRRRLHRRPRLDRGAARRPRQPLPRTAPQRLDQPGRVPRLRWASSFCAAPTAPQAPAPSIANVDALADDPQACDQPRNRDVRGGPPGSSAWPSSPPGWLP